MFDSSFQNRGVSLMQTRGWTCRSWLHLPTEEGCAHWGGSGYAWRTPRTAVFLRKMRGAAGGITVLMAPRLTFSPMARGHRRVPRCPRGYSIILAWDIQPDSRLPDSNIIRHTRLGRNSRHCVSRVSNPEPPQRTRPTRLISEADPERGRPAHSQMQPVP